MTDTDAIRAIADTYIAALNASDPAALAAIYADDARLEDPVGGGAVHEGIEAIRGFYNNLGSVDMTATLLEARVCGADLLFNFDLTTTFDADNAMTINVWDLMQFDDDNKVVSMRAYWGPDNVS